MEAATAAPDRPATRRQSDKAMPRHVVRGLGPGPQRPPRDRQKQEPQAQAPKPAAPGLAAGAARLKRVEAVAGLAPVQPRDAGAGARLGPAARPATRWSGDDADADLRRCAREPGRADAKADGAAAKAEPAAAQAAAATSPPPDATAYADSAATQTMSARARTGQAGWARVLSSRGSARSWAWAWT